MYAFPDLAELEACLGALLEAEPPLIQRLPRAPGAREARVAHLLSGPVESHASAQALAHDAAPARSGRLDQLEAEVATLRDELAELRGAFEAFKAQF